MGRWHVLMGSGAAVSALVRLLLVCTCAQAGGQVRNRMSAGRAAERLQATLQDIVSSSLLSSFSDDAYAAGSAKDRLMQLAAGKGTTVTDLDLSKIVAAVAKKAGELVAPMFAQMTEIGGDFDTLVANSRDKKRNPAGKCGEWPAENGWLDNRTTFVYPKDAQLHGSRSTAEFCSLFPPMRDYLGGMQVWR